MRLQPQKYLAALICIALVVNYRILERLAGDDTSKCGSRLGNQGIKFLGCRSSEQVNPTVFLLFAGTFLYAGTVLFAGTLAVGNDVCVGI